ncbi:MAG: hypothetical protein ACREB8_16070, partial [Pseudolabrys sp.]
QVIPNTKVQPTNGGMAAATSISLAITVSGTGDKDLVEKMKIGASQIVGVALARYDKAMPDRVAQITRDPRAR